MEILEAVERVNRKVAKENLQRYREFLKKKQFHKAFSRLQSCLRQDPEIKEAQDELAKRLDELRGRDRSVMDFYALASMWPPEEAIQGFPYPYVCAQIHRKL